MSSKKDLYSYSSTYDESKEGPSFIPLLMGAPGPSTLKGCSKLLAEATKLTLDDSDEEQYTFQYGPCKGDPGFCEELAKFLTEEYGDPVHSDDIMVTSGATQGLHLVATVMFNQSTPVFMEDPTYFIAVKILKDDLGMNVIPVPTDSEGIDVNILEELLEKYKPQSTDGLKTPFWGMVYTLPTYNNPKGYCMSVDRCKSLIQLARRYDVLLFAEDVYNMLHYDGSPHCPRRLLSYDLKSDPDFKGHVLSNGTFSKILAPGLRLGWIEAPPRVMKYVEKSMVAWSGGSFNHYTSKLLATVMRSGLLSSHVRELRQEYSERMHIACDQLTKSLPEEVKFSYPSGGFFIWLELPSSVNANEMLQLSVNKYKINFLCGSR